MSKNKKTYSNAKGEGRLFNMDVADKSGEIRITGFQELCDTVFDRVEVGKCYLISGGTLKAKNEQWNSTSHPYEVTLNRNCTVEDCEDPVGPNEIPKHNYKFINVAEIEQTPDDTKIDLLAMVHGVDEAINFTSKAGRECCKRVMRLTDQTGKGVEATIFGTGDASSDLRPGAVIALKAAKVGSWNTKSLTVWSDGFVLHPDLAEAHSLMGWWQNGGGSQQPQSISIAGGGGGGAANAARIHFSDIEDRALGLNGQPDYFSVRCTVTHIKTEDQRTLWYIACPACKKKVPNTDEFQLQGHCEKCNKMVDGVRRWIFSATCNDTSGSRLVSFFDDTAFKLLGDKTADELAPLRQAENSDAFNQHFISQSFKSYHLKCRIKSENYNDEDRLKVSCSALTPVDYVQEGNAMLQEISKLMNGA